MRRKAALKCGSKEAVSKLTTEQFLSPEGPSGRGWLRIDDERRRRGTEVHIDCQQKSMLCRAYGAHLSHHSDPGLTAGPSHCRPFGP